MLCKERVGESVAFTVSSGVKPPLGILISVAVTEEEEQSPTARATEQDGDETRLSP